MRGSKQTALMQTGPSKVTEDDDETAVDKVQTELEEARKDGAPTFSAYLRQLLE